MNPTRETLHGTPMCQGPSDHAMDAEARDSAARSAILTQRLRAYLRPLKVSAERAYRKIDHPPYPLDTILTRLRRDLIAWAAADHINLPPPELRQLYYHYDIADAKSST